MNTLDIVVLFLVFALGIKGFLRGFIKEVAGLVAIVGGIFLASRFSSSLADLFTSMFHIKSAATSSVLAFITLFAIIWFGITFAASLVSKAIDMSGMGIADRVLGFVASGGKIYLILSVIVFAVSNISFLQNRLEGFTKDSFLFEPMKAAGGFVMKLKPEDLNASAITDKVREEAMKEGLKEINKTLGATK